MDREELAWDIKVACFEILIVYEKIKESRSKCEEITELRFGICLGQQTNNFKINIY